MRALYFGTQIVRASSAHTAAQMESSTIAASLKDVRQYVALLSTTPPNFCVIVWRSDCIVLTPLM
jgi:hypothetical protein